MDIFGSVLEVLGDEVLTTDLGVSRAEGYTDEHRWESLSGEWQFVVCVKYWGSVF